MRVVDLSKTSKQGKSRSHQLLPTYRCLINGIEASINPCLPGAVTSELFMKDQMNQHSKDAVMRALEESMIAYQICDNKLQLVIEDDMTALRQVQLIVNTTIAISKHHGDLFTLQTEKRTGRRYVNASLTGKALHMCLKTPLDEMLKYFYAHALNPYVEVFIKTVEQHGVDQMPIYPLNTYHYDEAGDFVKSMNACGADIRKKTGMPEFKKAIRKAQRSCNKNFGSVMTYFKQLFQKKGRLLGLRGDFSYNKTINFDQAGSYVSYEQAKRHREAFIAYIRKHFKGDLIGYVWKFEFGLLKGYHSHLIIFLDGANVREDVTIMRMLGEHWKSVVTEGIGAYHNCNAKKEGYRFCGIGMLHHDKPVFWEGLKNIATYLTKLDYYVKLNVPGKDRAFGKGGPPKLYAKKRGRPRKFGETPD